MVPFRSRCKFRCLETLRGSAREKVQNRGEREVEITFLDDWVIFLDFGAAKRGLEGRYDRGGGNFGLHENINTTISVP
eukprot:2929276-Rhodomonas_salina.1